MPQQQPRRINIGAAVNGAAVIPDDPPTEEEARRRFQEIGRVDPDDPEARRAPSGEQAELIENEHAMLDGMFRLAKRAHDRLVKIEVPDPDDPSKTVFSFTVHPLTDEQVEACTRDPDVATFKRNALGHEVVVDTNGAAFRSLLIVTATVKEDQRRIWHNEDLLRHAGVASSLELVDRMLPPGFKALIVEKIDALSGYRSEAARERILGK